MSTGAGDAPVSGPPAREDDGEKWARVVAEALKDGFMKLREYEDVRMSELKGEIERFRGDEENRVTRLEKAIADLKPPPSNVDPTTNFWTVYKKVADEHDNDLVSKYAGDLDTSLLFAGLFSAVTTTFIVQIIPQLQPNPVDLTNVLLLRILQQNASFGGADPLAPISDIPIGVVRAQAILLTSLCLTLFVAFIAVLGKQWILYYTQVTTWGNIVDRGRERQVKLVGLQTWGFHLIMESLPVMLQFALLLFGIALAVYLWDLNISVGEVVVVVTSAGIAFYTGITVAATAWSDCPFQTPLSMLLPRVIPRAKELTRLIRVWLRRRTTALTTPFLLRVQRVAEHSSLASPLKSLLKAFPTATAIATDDAEKNAFCRRYPMVLSNPAFWRHDPLFASSIPKDVSASAGFWLLENSTDFSAASAVAAVFSEIQWPSHHDSTTALTRLRDTYTECFRAPELNKSARLKALQSAAAYYVLYHTQLIWSISESSEAGVESISNLSPDLFLQHGGEWDGDDVFEYLLRIEDRTAPVTSARFLSYIAPYWFCGDSDATVRFRPSRLQNLEELIEVLGKHHALNAATITDCILCVGAVMDFPLHPEDLIRVDKSNYFVSTFKAVVEHIHGIVLAKGRRRRHAEKALEILVTLVKKTPPPLVDAPLPLIDGAWITQLLRRAAEKKEDTEKKDDAEKPDDPKKPDDADKMDDEKFTLFLRLSARRKEEEPAPDAKTPTDATEDTTISPPHEGNVPPEAPVSADILFTKIMRNVRTCTQGRGGWHDEAVYGGLIAIRDIPGLGTCLPGPESLQTLSKAMEKEAGDQSESKPFRVRKAAYNVILAAREGWLKSKDLRETLESLDIPRKLHSVVTETGNPNHQRSFLEMIEILAEAEDKYWHSYLRKAMHIWLPLHHDGPSHVLHILITVGELIAPGCEGSRPPLDKPLEKFIEDEWLAVPGRLVQDLTADRLEPLAEATAQFKRQLSANRDSDRRAIQSAVEKVVPALERRREQGYDGPGAEIRKIIDELLRVLQSPAAQSTRPRSVHL